LDRFELMLDHMLEPPRPVRRIELITGGMGRRRWPTDEKARILEEAAAPGAVVSEVARRNGMTPQHLFAWRREAKQRSSESGLTFTPVVLTTDPPPSPRGDSSAPCIEIAIAGALIRVPPGADARLLSTILQTLKAG
jgi:transposase